VSAVVWVPIPTGDTGFLDSGSKDGGRRYDPDVRAHGEGRKDQEQDWNWQ
jgi:hypothetical protein